MTTQRIGDRDLGREATKTLGGQSRWARLSAAIASPTGILTLLPLLVASIGLLLTFVGQRALRESNLSMAGDRIREETTLLARTIEGALEQADPVMDRLAAVAREHDPIQPYDETAHSLRDLMQGRPGVSYISISYPDGTFQGAYRDSDGQIRFQDARVTPKGTKVKRYTLIGHRRIEPYFEESTSYDPRTRPFYALATESDHRVWTKPYPFFKTHYTGVTRAEALHNADGALHAVITVDFDVTALSAVLSRTSMGGATTLLYADDGTVLAYPRGEGRINDLPLRSDRALLYGDLADPLLDAFFQTRGTRGEVSAASDEYLVAVRPIEAGKGLPWSVATLMPKAHILSALHRHQDQSAVAAAIATLLASALAWLFARHILRARREIAVARAEAKEAAARAQELGSYRLVERLGKGGMGEVWRAEHRLLVRQAAIKLISLGEGTGIDAREMQERFRREAQSLATLRSRNTIELFDYGVTDAGTCFYVMELLDGMDLETLVAHHGPQPAARVIDFLIQACNSLAEAHDAGLVHRDIKPANLYVCRIADEVDVVKVLDFGLVRSALGPASLPPPRPDSGLASEKESGVHGTLHAGHASDADPRITQVGQAMGTPAYMAPEQALGQELDGRADLYALACVAFFLLTGRLVFQREGSLPMMMAHITEPAPDCQSCTKNYVPEALALLIQQCLAKQPQGRPANARVLAGLLKAIAIPAEQRFSEAKAQAWWASRSPPPFGASSEPEMAARGVA
jgi:serine/threonine protein kinase